MKKTVFFGLLVIILAFHFIGCDNGNGGNSGNGGGEAFWPANLSGTKWEKEWFGTLEFKTNNTFYFNFIVDAYPLVSAVENGKIVIMYKGENETLCTSYSISGNTLTFTNPSRKLIDEVTAWTKVN